MKRDNVNDRIKNIKIQDCESILTALKQMDLHKVKMLLVFKKNIFLNVLSIGDIQRAILKNISLDSSIKLIFRKKTRVANSKDSFDEIKRIIYKFRIECMPVIDNEGKLIDVYFWNDIFGKNEKRVSNKISLPVIIMAGGKGTRLKPITNVIPKPLIPFGDKTIIENIMDRFTEVGCVDFLLSINYKAETIRHYFDQLQNEVYKISYFQEKKPLGTAGSLFLIKEKINSTFFVSNCDIIIDEDYTRILKYHQDNNNELTIVSALKYYSIPYGTIETGNRGVLIELKEKPEFTFQINTGMYVLEPHLLDEIPENKFFHITNLIENIQKRNGKVGVFPVNEASWRDIGDWNEYLKNLKIKRL